MKLNDIRVNVESALNFMERLVNNGSPSGFTEKNTSSDETNPFKVSEFYLIKYESKVEHFGVIPSQLQSLDGLLLHPDWKKYIVDQSKIKSTTCRVCPTASLRTAKVYDENYYIKLSYPAVIGRLKRDLQEKHLISCIQMTEMLEGLINNPLMPSSFAFLPERGGVIGYIDSVINNKYKKIETGYIIRDARPIGKNVDKIKNIVPAFSLFGKDRKNDSDAPLLQQIMATKDDGNECLLLQYIYPLIDIYFTCLLEEGLSPEMHSQNVLFGYDDEWNVVSVILRDLESIDKDITIRTELNKSKFVNDYKTIKDTDYNYLIKHSFMFDHKLGEYLVDELIKCVEKCSNINEVTLRKAVKQYVKDKYGTYFQKLFPSNGKWYKFEDVEIDRESDRRPYLAMDNSVFR